MELKLLDENIEDLIVLWTECNSEPNSALPVKLEHQLITPREADIKYGVGGSYQGGDEIRRRVIVEHSLKALGDKAVDYINELVSALFDSGLEVYAQKICPYNGAGFEGKRFKLDTKPIEINNSYVVFYKDHHPATAFLENSTQDVRLAMKVGKGKVKVGFNDTDLNTAICLRKIDNMIKEYFMNE